MVDDTQPRLVSCDEEMPTVVPTGPVRAKAVCPAFEQLGDENQMGHVVRTAKEQSKELSRRNGHAWRLARSPRHSGVSQVPAAQC